MDIGIRRKTEKKKKRKGKAVLDKRVTERYIEKVQMMGMDGKKWQNTTRMKYDMEENQVMREKENLNRGTYLVYLKRQK